VEEAEYDTRKRWRKRSMTQENGGGSGV